MRTSSHCRHWAQNSSVGDAHRPEHFLPHLAAWSRVALYPLPAESYRAWTSMQWKICGHEFLYGGPLFMHVSLWIDFRGSGWVKMRRKASTIREQPPRLHAQQAYAIPIEGFTGEHMWGISASNGPGPATRRVNGVALPGMRAVPYNLTTGRWRSGQWLRRFRSSRKSAEPSALHVLPPSSEHGLVCSINPTFPGSQTVWLDFARAFRPRSGSGCDRELPLRPGWRLMRRCPYIIEGLGRAGFGAAG